MFAGKLEPPGNKLPGFQMDLFFFWMLLSQEKLQTKVESDLKNPLLPSALILDPGALLLTFSSWLGGKSRLLEQRPRS